jgi:hypothetical protein
VGELAVGAVGLAPVVKQPQDLDHLLVEQPVHRVAAWRQVVQPVVGAPVRELGVQRGGRLVDVVGVVEDPQHLLALDLRQPRGCGDASRWGLGGGGLLRCRR